MPGHGHAPGSSGSLPASSFWPAEAADRQPLPRDPDTLPAPGPDFDAVVARSLDELDLDLTPGMRDAIDAHARLLLAWNAYVNLTAIREPAGIALEHVADSLAAVPLLLDRLAAVRRPRRPTGLLDLGSGAGYPGLPVSLAIPAGHAVLVDSVGRRVAFLEVAARAAARAFDAHGEEPVPIRVLQARAEALGRDPQHRDQWEIVTARAVAPMPRLVELALPLVRPGGLLLAWKRDAGDGALEAELATALPLMEALGADPEPVVEQVTVDGLRDHRLVVVPKRSATPQRWPRPASHRRPLLP